MKIEGALRVAIAISASAAAGVALHAQQIQVSKENKTIAISASEEASAPADTAIVSVGFQSFGKDQQALYAEAAQTSNAIVAALTQAGVSKDAIESTDQGLRPVGAFSDEDKARYAQGIRFVFSQSWRVTVGAGAAAKTLQVAIAAGANNSGNVDWQLKNDEALQAQAAAKALERARSIAGSMAQGLGTKLGGLLYASNQVPARGVFATEMSAMARSEGSVAHAKAEPLAIEAQRITRSATVYAVFAIE